MISNNVWLYIGTFTDGERDYYGEVRFKDGT